MKGNDFNDNSRVQVPAALHLYSLGYTYLDNISQYDKLMTDYDAKLTEMFAESHRLEEGILS